MYLEGYDSETIYHDLRCGIVHNYSEGGSYIFMDSLPDLHFYKSIGGIGKICLNLENFISDIETATEKYFSELVESDDLLALAQKRMTETSILRIQNHI